MQEHLTINNLCNKCDNCLFLCPEESVFKVSGSYFIDQSTCTLCGICSEVCPTDAVKLVSSNTQVK